MEEVDISPKYELLKVYLDIFQDGQLTLPAMVVEAVAVAAPQVARLEEEVVVKSPDSSVEQFRPSNARLFHNVREVFIV